MILNFSFFSTLGLDVKIMTTFISAEGKSPLRIQYLSPAMPSESTRIPPQTISSSSDSSFFQPNQPSVVTPRQEEETSSLEGCSSSSHNQLISPVQSVQIINPKNQSANGM